MRKCNIDEVKLCEKYVNDEKVSMRQLAIEFGTSRPTVSRILKRNGIEIRTRKHTSTQIKEALDLYFDKKYSSNKIQKMYGFTSGQLYRLIRKDSRYTEIERDTDSKAWAEMYDTTDDSLETIARKVNYSRAYVTKKVAEQHAEGGFGSNILPKRRRSVHKLPITHEELAKEYHETGFSYATLAKKYGVSESCIYHALSRLKGRK